MPPSLCPASQRAERLSRAVVPPALRLSFARQRCVTVGVAAQGGAAGAGSRSTSAPDTEVSRDVDRRKIRPQECRATVDRHHGSRVSRIPWRSYTTGSFLGLHSSVHVHIQGMRWRGRDEHLPSNVSSVSLLLTRITSTQVDLTPHIVRTPDGPCDEFRWAHLLFKSVRWMAAGDSPTDSTTVFRRACETSFAEIVAPPHERRIGRKTLRPGQTHVHQRPRPI